MAFQALNTLTIRRVRLDLLLSCDNFVMSPFTIQHLYVDLKLSTTRTEMVDSHMHICYWQLRKTPPFQYCIYTY